MSFYRFKRDNSFDSGPNGLSGRTIVGRWRLDDEDVFIVEGRWGWINGQGLGDDYRWMTMRTPHIDGAGTIQSLPVSGVVNSVRVHRGSYYIDDMVRQHRAYREIPIRTTDPRRLNDAGRSKAITAVACSQGARGSPLAR